MITDVRAYAALETAFEPRYVIRTQANEIFVSMADFSTPINATTLAGSSDGVFFIPFRPAQSPDPWMYIAAREDYQKISTPDASDNVVARNVGLQEPQRPPEAAPTELGFVEFSGEATDWTNSGTAGAITDGTRTTDTIQALEADPVFASRWSIEVSDDQFYQVGQSLYFDVYYNVLNIVQDVIPPINSGAGIAIEAIFYRTGSTGACVIVPNQNAISSLIPGSSTTPVSGSILTDPVLAGLRRGALIELQGDTTETVLVLSVTKGPTGQMCFECETTGTFVATDVIIGVPTIVVESSSLSPASVNDPIRSKSMLFAVSGSGIANVQQSLSTNPFTTDLETGSGLVQTVQLDDYLNFAVNISDPSKLTVGRLIFNVGDTVDYTTEFYYLEFTASDLLRNIPPVPTVTPTGSTIPTFEEFVRQQLAGSGGGEAYIQNVIAGGFFVNALRLQLLDQYNSLYGNVSTPSFNSDTTIYPSSSWVVIQVPIRSLTHGGTNQIRSLADCNGVRLQLQVTDAINVQMSCFWIGGGGQPDVGRVGSTYYYIARGRDSRTGVKGNPSPATRYGVSPRRQQVLVQLVDSVLDPQMDTWDIYRYGGVLTSWRYLGSMPNTGGGTDEFMDNLFDTSIATTFTLERDNFEPWPSIDLPFEMTGTATVVGTILQIAFTSVGDVPPNILRWLPGTLLLIDNVAYTLWTRPVVVTGNTYRLELAECIGASTPTTVKSNEPILARQRLVSVFGPDAAGTVFGCGDPLRPGTLSYAKSYDPDSVPDAYNREIVQPSEPLIGGVIIDGLASVASSARWWDLYPQFGASVGAERYQPVERGVGRGLAAQYAFCSDGKNIFFVAKDGIWVKEGAGGRSMTDAAGLRKLFPHEGVNGRDIEYAGLTVYAPDYRRSQSFRLSYAKSYLYFDYEDTTGDRRTLVCDITKGIEKPCWSVDDYADPITVHYWLEGPENNSETVTDLYPILVMGDANDRFYKQKDLTNDNGVPIDGAIATFEYNGGDVRADQFWGDGMVDALPLSGLTVTPISDKIASGAATTVPASSVRERSVIHSAGIEAKTLGYLTQWTDDFDYLYAEGFPTTLYAWQPLYQAVPLKVFTWKTQGTSFGLQGYFHIRETLAAYRSTATVILTITTYDGQDPTTIILPSTNDEERKILFPFSANKGLLYFFQGESEEPWYPYFDAWEFHVGQWGRTDPYKITTDVEGPKGIGRSIDS
jgi:hypothetical protein